MEEEFHKEEEADEEKKLEKIFSFLFSSYIELICNLVVSQCFDEYFIQAWLITFSIHFPFCF